MAAAFTPANPRTCTPAPRAGACSGTRRARSSASSPPRPRPRPPLTQLQLDFTNRPRRRRTASWPSSACTAQGASANQLVTLLQQANAPNAVPDYVVPGASVGYMLGYDESFQTTPNSADGNPVKFEVVIICAVRHGYAICAYAAGPHVDLNRIVNHFQGEARPVAVGRPRCERRPLEGRKPALSGWFIPRCGMWPPGA